MRVGGASGLVTPEQSTTRVFARRGGPGQGALDGLSSTPADGEMTQAMARMLSMAAETTSASITSAEPYHVSVPSASNAAGASPSRLARPWTHGQMDVRMEAPAGAVASALTRGK